MREESKIASFVSPPSLELLKFNFVNIGRWDSPDTLIRRLILKEVIPRLEFIEMCLGQRMTVRSTRVRICNESGVSGCVRDVIICRSSDHGNLVVSPLDTAKIYKYTLGWNVVVCYWTAQVSPMVSRRREVLVVCFVKKIKIK